MWRNARDCERARAAVSLELDGELSMLERAYMDAHVARCDSCGAFRDDVLATSMLLRAQPLEQMAQSVTVSYRRGMWYRHLPRIATSAAALVMVGLLATTQFGRSPAPFARVGAAKRDAGSRKELRQIYAEYRLVGHRATLSPPASQRVV